MAHRLPNHNGKCSRLHGHRYRAQFEFSGAIDETGGSSSEGMVADFSDLGKIIKEKIEAYDHRCMLSQEDPISILAEDGDIGIIIAQFIPTAENIAECLAMQMKIAIEKEFEDVDLIAVTVWETPTSFARWEPSALSDVRMMKSITG